MRVIVATGAHPRTSCGADCGFSRVSDHGGTILRVPSGAYETTFCGADGDFPCTTDHEMVQPVLLERMQERCAEHIAVFRVPRISSEIVDGVQFPPQE